MDLTKALVIVVGGAATIAIAWEARDLIQDWRWARARGLTWREWREASRSDE
jgi:hypothetical protein